LSSEGAVEFPFDSKKPGSESMREGNKGKVIYMKAWREARLIEENLRKIGRASCRERV
jgi:hypothetical protein